MQKQKSGFIEWAVYCLALVSLTLLIYVFTTRNTNTIIPEIDKTSQTLMMEDSPVKDTNNLINLDDNEQSPPVMEANQPKLEDSKVDYKDKENSNIIAAIQKPAIKKVEELGTIQKDKSKDRSKKVKVEKKDIPSSSKKKKPIRSNKQKHKEQRKVIAKKKNSIKCNNTTCSKKGSYEVQYCLYVNMYAKPVKVSKRNYNKRVLNHYKEKPDSRLLKVGTYKVRKGDTIFSIAQVIGIKAINIIAINKSIGDPDNLKVGQIIGVPNK